MEPLITRPPNEAGEKTLVRDISWCGVFNGANASMVDVKDGKIIRIRPARYYDQYTKEEVKPWVMHARGKTFEPERQEPHPAAQPRLQEAGLLPGPHPLPHEARGLRPQRRAGSTGPGGRNIQNRGVSKYERISWDEALDIVTGEMLRIKETYGPTAILYQYDQHGENKVVHGPHGCGRKLLEPVRRLHPPGPRPRQLGRLVVGGQARVGLRAGGPADAAEEPALRHLQERRAAPLLGLRPGDHRLGLAGPAPQPPQLLVDRAGHQADLHRPRRQLRQRRARRQVDPRPAQHRRRPLPGHRPPVVQERHLRQGVPRDPRLRRGQVRGLRHGPGRRRSPRPPSGRRPSPACRPASSRRWPTSGPPSAPPSSSATAARASAAPTPPSRPACRCSAWPCRAWASRAATRPR